MSLADRGLHCLPVSARVSVLRARGLRIKGKDGTNDAYAALQAGRETFRTPVSEKRAEPVWGGDDAAFIFTLPPETARPETDAAALQVRVLHRVPLAADKLLGLAVVDVHELRRDGARENPRWFKLFNKAGKADKERGEVLLDVEFLKSSMSVSMIDLSDKSHSRLGKFKDKLRGKKRDGLSDSASAIVPSVTQVLTDSEGEMDGEAETAKKKKNKLKSLFVPKSGMKRNSLSQSMSSLGTLPDKNSSVSSSTSSGLNVESEGKKKKKFTFLTHKRSGSTDSKASNQSDVTLGSANQNAVSPVEICINGSHVYREEPRSEEVQEEEEEGENEEEEQGWRREREEQERLQEVRRREAEEERMRNEEEEQRRKEEEKDRIRIEREEEEKERKRMEREREERRRVEEDQRKITNERENEERRRMEEEERERIKMEREKERRRLEEEERERIRMERDMEEERKRVEREKEEERRRIEREGERERVRSEREKEVKRRMVEEERERIRMDREKEEEKRRVEEEERERVRMEREKEQERRRAEEEERERVRMEREKEEERRRAEKEERERVKMEREKEERRRAEEEERERVRMEREKEEERRQAEKEERERVRMEREKEQERRRAEEKERVRMEREKEEERRRAEEEEDRERIRMEREKEVKRRMVEEEKERKRAEREKEEQRKRIEEEEEEERERQRMEKEERKRKEEREAEELRRKEESDRKKAEEEKKQAERKRVTAEEEKERKKAEEEEEKRRRAEENEKRHAEEERKRAEEEKEKEKEKRMREEQERVRREEKALFEERVASQSDFTRSARISNVKPSVSVPATVSQVVNTNPFLDDDFDSSISESASIAEAAAKKGRAPLPPYTKTHFPSPDGSRSKEVSKRPAPPPPGTLKMSREVTDGAKNPERDDESKVPSVSEDEAQVDCNPFTSDEPAVVKHNQRPTPKPRMKTVHLEEGQPSMWSAPNEIAAKDDDDQSDVAVGPHIATPKTRVNQDFYPEPQVSLLAGRPNGEICQKKSRAPLPPAKPKRTGDPSIPHQPPHLQNKANLEQTRERDGNKKDQDEAPSDIPTARTSSIAGSSLTFSSHAEKPQVGKPCAVQVVSGSQSRTWANGAPNDAGQVKEQIVPASVIRQHAVKPLSAAENQPEMFESRVSDNMQPKTKAAEAVMKGPYSQLTQAELISMALRQQEQISQRDARIQELEQYIDNLLVRVMEEKPTILMSLNAMKKSA